MRQLDSSLGDLLGQQADLTVDMTEDLAMEVRKVEAMLLEIDQVVAELDCILAMTATCETFGLVRPRMVEENVLIIQKGRHILYEMANDAYISNDTDMRHRINVEDESSSAVKETLEQGLVASAFMIDLSQVSMMLRGATARSLLVLDEFGKGTLPQDGAGLFIGTLEEFLSRGSDCPKIIAITHFHEIFQTNITHIDFSPFAWQMKTHFQDDRGERDQLSFLFQLERPRELEDLQSSAAECALHYGVSAAIVERAKVVTGHVTRQEIAKIVEEVEISPSEALELSQAESLTRAFLKWDLSQEGDDVESTKKALEAMLETANRIGNEA
ncbi:hypothetical protein QFC24_002567 [Naganishia onofrii]|uniref:Uncharacterized protein n=1 Tax=Naganishia onofrii TaxID=1851511 RepID=A0ACC2XP48_9TREE|nr:hypothetical protein QFC24_002567 [Naganishia onofrii]